ncbi:toxin VasX [Pseudomonas sp. GD03944]|uniref:toxin VasX n=1 Tax=Pseudomonas sp. GD03944 TaxID=2975409 RepID=UPI00244719D1|nr:toxin VasX [Pseudomonas sp. GD03944]MDH1263802.1 hypothetical protein [Pseudomonas sp. GD03944]
MTAHTATPKDANLAAMALDSTDACSPVGVCPLMKSSLQLIPLRYGLVQHHTPTGMSLPLQSQIKSRPIGVRLMRDGYLYIIDERTGYLHEYRVENGRATKLLWKGAEATADTRTSTTSEPIVFSRRSALYVAYSEIQWTARKCSQVLAGKAEREHYMQHVNLANAGPSGGAHLLTRQQTEQAVAEVAERFNLRVQALPEGASDEEGQPYVWEDQPLYRDTVIGELTAQVVPEYQNNHLFLVVRDDIGVLRDLRAYQEKVIDWIGEWSADDDTQQRYITGTYLHSLYAVDEQKVRAMATVDPRYQALLDETNEYQREKIYAYIKAVNTHGPSLYAGTPDFLRQQKNLKPTDQATLEMYDALGPELHRRHRPTINELRIESWRELTGRGLGSRGINDLVKRPEMEAFVEKHQFLLQHWHGILDRVRGDRLGMVTEGLFHRAAWFYDFNSDSQIKHRLETEFACVRELCSRPEDAEKLAKYLDKSLLPLVTGLDTLSLADQKKSAENLANLTQLTINALDAPGSIADINSLANQFNGLVSRSLPNFANLQSQFAGLQTLLDHAYSPAAQLEMADEWERTQHRLLRNEAVNPNDFIRNTGPASHVRLLRDFANSGLTVRAATPAELQQYAAQRDNAIALRKELNEAYRARRTSLARQAVDLEPLGSEGRFDQRIAQIRIELIPLEERLAGSLSPAAGTPGKIGTVLDGMDAATATEMQNAARDFRNTGTFRSGFNAAATNKGNLIAGVVFYFQLSNLVSAVTDLFKQESVDSTAIFNVADAFIKAASSGAAASQGVAASVLQARIMQMGSAAGKLNAMSSLGRWSATLGKGAFFLGGVAAGTDAVKHINQWGDALTEGNNGALAATTIQLAGDATLVGTNVWALQRTYQISQAARQAPAQLRAMAWASRSPMLLSVAARANIIGLIGTALQLVGEGLYNYYNLDALKRWMQSGIWGIKPQPQSLEESWLALARIVQQPSCKLHHAEQRSEFLLTLPGVRTTEVNSRIVGIKVFQNETLAPIAGQRWASPAVSRDRSKRWAGQAYLKSKGDEALTVALPVDKLLFSKLQNMTIVISYQLNEVQGTMHDTAFIINNLHINSHRSYIAPSIGMFPYKATKTIPSEIKNAPPQVLLLEELAISNAQ